ncbi:hypothetical protein D3H55_22400 [Bacillus salacetis]|uniref:Uncharacterized protein n=1 Tax=Bacillus salacetis TaxID=2315464 RepID=A0A3A1QMG8_9BACI|nr:hypothetical protein [Bacillus salacetis]RIW28009.1 hypothetical protein D3H55_22400 [Bacillus salacetis]
MLRTILKVALSFLAGYLFINWCPVITLIRVSDMIVEFVLNPVRFFASSIAFMAAVLISAELIKNEASMILNLFQGNCSAEILVFPIHLAGVYYLSTIGLWQTMLLLSLSIVYGMISIDFSGNSRRTS